ncbi:MAG: hypothetical protein ACI90V_007965 [Bacillariaceae sp.]|jgi:hypothetical protein
MYSNGNGNGDDDDDVPMIELATGPIIVPLLQGTLPPSGGNKAIFSIIAADVSSEYKGKARLCCLRTIGCSYNKDDEELGNNIHSKPKKKTEQYRKIRQEFICFMCCYGLVAIIGLTVIFCFVLYPAIHENKKWSSMSDRHDNHDYHNFNQTINTAVPDSRYNNEGKNFFQKMNDFIFADGFAGDDDAS